MIEFMNRSAKSARATSRPIVGCVADDYTGATDLGGMFSGNGVRTVQFLGCPQMKELRRLSRGYDAVIIALKSRSAAPSVARRLVSRATRMLMRLRPRQFQLKYCSTFDSTPRGNIGPSTEEMLACLREDFTVAIPSLPVNGRTVYNGYLFVNGVLLSESHMRHHPTNPMTDSNIVRFLSAQTRLRVGLVNHEIVSAGAKRTRVALSALRRRGVSVAVMDAVSEEDMRTLARAVADFRLVTAASGLGDKLPEVWRRRGLLRKRGVDPGDFVFGGKTLAISGSCSTATQEQVRLAEGQGFAALQIPVREMIDRPRGVTVARIVSAGKRLFEESEGVLVYSTVTQKELAEIQGRARRKGISPGALAGRVERVLAQTARRLVGELGIRKVACAGGETAGSVMKALGVGAIEIGLPIDPGVPVCRSLGRKPLGLVLKSGNFGRPDFFRKAAEVLSGGLD